MPPGPSPTQRAVDVLAAVAAPADLLHRELGLVAETARTIRKHFDGILAYVQTRLTNGLTEGFNNKLRVIARRAYGFHSPQPLIAMLLLCCGGIKLDPPLARPAMT